MSRSMRAVICDGFDGPGALRVGEMPESALSAGKVRVDIHAASVSFMDCVLVSGKYQMKPATPFVPGTDGAGIVKWARAWRASSRATVWCAATGPAPTPRPWARSKPG